MEAEERQNAKEERRQAQEKAKEKARREGKKKWAAERTPGWPRSFYAGSTCTTKTHWSVRYKKDDG